MHIPDGFLDAKTLIATSVLSATGLAAALRQARKNPPRRAPLMGVAAAFVFATQMLNFPVAAGTSGHLIGGVLVAVLLGPAPAVIVMASVLVLQCLLFADGGVLALGANIFNMAIVGTVGGCGIYRAVRAGFGGLRGRLMAVAFAAWCSTVLASLSCAGQLAWSGTVPARVIFPVMGSVHMLIGAGEAVITALVVLAVARARPDLMEEGRNDRLPSGRLETVLLGLLVALGLALFVAPFACPWPDGLEKIAGALGFEHRTAPKSFFPALIPDYRLPGVGTEGMSVALAGGLGVLVMFALAWLISRVLVPCSQTGAAPSPDELRGSPAGKNDKAQIERL